MTAGQSQSTQWHFDRFALDLRRRALCANGKPVMLDAKPFDLLVFLIERRAQPVGPAEILARVWEGRVVDPRNVAVQLSVLRSAFRKAGCEQPLIMTHPGPRYQFIGELAEAPPEAPPSERAGGESDAPMPPAPIPPAPIPPAPIPPAPGPVRRWRRGRVVAGLVLASLLLTAVIAARRIRQPAVLLPRLSIAVLQFRNLSDDRSQDYLTYAITDDLRSDLSRIPASKVIGRRSVDAVHDQPPQQIGRELGVRYMLDGSISPEGGRYHVIVSLTDTSTGEALWTRTFEEDDARLSAVREFIVRTIASELHVQLDLLESTRSLHDRPNDADALDLFFQARAILDTAENQQSAQAAQRLLERAIAQQPDFGDALAELSWLLLHKIQTADSETEEDHDWIEASGIIDKTVKLVPRNSKAIASLGRKLFIEGKYPDAGSNARYALSINGNSTEARWILADCAWISGNLDEQAAELGQISALDPKSPANKHLSFSLGVVRLLQGRVTEAIGLLLASIAGEPEPELGAETMGLAENARVWLIAAFGLNSEHDRAAALYKKYNEAWPHRSVWRFAAYLPRAIASQVGASRVLDALHDAGMPSVADERIALPAGSTCVPDVYSSTPASLPDGRVITTSQLAALRSRGPKPLILDLGEGSAAPPDAQWFDPGGPPESVKQFVDRVVSNGESLDQRTKVVVMADGPFGCAAYNAALQLRDDGRAVSWYRSGEEGWAAAGQVTKDFRP